MTIELFAHPFSSYCQKAIAAFYENGIPFEFRMLEPGNDAWEELALIWPIGKFPVLREGDRVVPEATSIIEYLHVHHPGPVRLIPDAADAALEVRRLDRFFDNYIATPQQKLVADLLRPEAERDPRGVAEARAMLDKAYAWLEGHVAGREWAAGDYSLADCAAGPFLFYADWSHPMDGRFPNVAAYRQRLMARPAFKRCIDEARPYRAFFPGGAPDRD